MVAIFGQLLGAETAAFCNYVQWLTIADLGPKVCPIENNTNLNSIFCLIKSSKIDLIFLPAFYLIM